MNKRILKVFIFFISIFIFMIFNLKKISMNEKLYENAINQSSYKLKISDLRGMIYDRNNLPLLETEEKIFTVVSPYSKNVNEILKHIDKNEIENFKKKLNFNKPFVVSLSSVPNIKDLQLFKTLLRTKKNILSVHTIGYVNNENKGVIGIEKSYDEFLKKDGNIEIEYKSHAGRNLIFGGKYHVKNASLNNGIKLCIDKKIQMLVEDVANKYLTEGAVIVTKVPDCQILACVSVPSFSPKNANQYLNDKKKPFINRIVSPYNVGSIFKLLTAITMIESGLEDNYYNCTGCHKLESGCKFHCYLGAKHGNINLKKALSYSCNGYFAEISKIINTNKLIEYSKKLGFGNETLLSPGFYSNKGNLPILEQLKNERDKALFCFGQGCLMATPIQISAFINAIASDGYYSEPKLVLELLNENNSTSEKNIYNNPKKCFKESTAKLIKSYMLESIINGTSVKGNPKNCTAAAKTSTAETGMFNGKERISHSWFAGFLPYEKPEYCITILAENQECCGNSCSPVFKEIAENIFNF